MALRIGHGYDVHQFCDDRPLIIGAVHIPYEKGLKGHSDADVLLHALTDALLGAAALGDIGQHFPDTDESYKGADSLKLLAKVVKLLKTKGWKIENTDMTLVLQKPKIASYIPKMRENISKVLNISISCVSVKATTEEYMGFTGSGKGAAAHAVVLLSNA